MISLNRQLVSSAVPKPANIRIVHSFERYIDAYGPRVYGYTPGNSPSSGPYTGSSGMPDIVVNGASRSFDASNACCHCSRGFMPPMISWTSNVLPGVGRLLGHVPGGLAHPAQRRR